MAKITNERTQAFRKAFEQNSKQIALQRGVVKNGIRASAENIQTHVENTLQEKSQTKNNLDAAGCLRH